MKSKKPLVRADKPLIPHVMGPYELIPPAQTLEQFTADMNDALYQELHGEPPPRNGNWGGAREGAGRPGIKDSVRVRVSPDIAEFVSNPANYQKIWNLMNGHS